jgi:ABC-type oligopeptide transport system substrate-binding subunit/serine/threonine protein kinase
MMKIGHKFDDRYRLDVELGRGGMGVVYRAHDTLLERDVAVKVLTAAAMTDQGRQRLLREARAVARLSHPNIVRVFDAGEAEVSGYELPLPYIVMEYVAGIPLHDYQPADLAETTDIAIQVSRALDHAHQQGVVHRDLKPENILVTPDGKALLMDFGLASAGASRLTTEGAILGTVFYLAPELALGKDFDGRADLYALGVLLYELTTGQLPFSADDPVAVIGQHLHQPATPPRSLNPEISEELNTLILQLLSKDAEDRPASANMVAKALLELTGGKDSSVPTIVETSAGLPSFLKDADQRTLEEPVFVAREGELARLDQFLEGILSGRGSVAFVSGSPGRGKSALIDAFSRRVQEQHPDLIVAQGSCNALTGAGDPYAPFRQVLAMLSGDVEAKWASGAISRSRARRLWELMPTTATALLNHGPDLIDIFVPGKELLYRASLAAPAGAEWIRSLSKRIRQEKTHLGEREQVNLFQQYTQVIEAIAKHKPLLILLDDLQWADSASIDLLFHIAREIKESRILILGAYRPEEVALGRGDRRHPLESVLNEFKRLFGDVWVDLSVMGETEDRYFTESILDVEPNRLSAEFRQTLFHHTEGHPLFTIELLRNLQERGDLVRDGEGRWVESPELDWNILPARIEGVIEERIDRLADELRQILTVASVEGEDFTAQVISRVQEIRERDLLRKLTTELARRHRLVHGRGEKTLGDKTLSIYQFSHTMIQQFIYNGLTPGERRLLHKEIGEVLETLYAGQTEEISVQLARNFGEAGEGDKAIKYILQAGDRAREVYAYQEAIDLYQQALIKLKESPDYDLATRTLMKLGLTYHLVFDFQRAQSAYQEAFTLRQSAKFEVRPATGPPAPHALRSLWSEPMTLDPSFIGDDVSANFANQIFCGLVEVTQEMNIVPEIADRWQVLDGGRRYIFYLRDDLRWSDGVQLTAYDFEYAWKRALDPRPGSQAAWLFYDLTGAQDFHQGITKTPDNVGVKAVDDFTLDVELDHPASYFLHLLTNPATFPVPRHTVESLGPEWTAVENMVSYGPFLLQGWQPGEQMILTRNPGYLGHFPGNLERVELTLREDWENDLKMYADDQLDIIGGIPIGQVVITRQVHARDYVTFPTATTVYLGFDLSQAPFEDPLVRRAFAHAIDKEHLANVVMRGITTPATGGFVPPGLPGYSPGIGLSYDPTYAKQLLQEAGYPDGMGSLDVEMYLPKGEEEMLKSVHKNFSEILGVDLKLNVLKSHDLIKRVRQRLPRMYILGWSADYPDPDNFLRVWVGQYLKQGWNESYQRLIDKARVETDQGTRLEYYQEAERILIDEALLIPLLHGRWHLLVKPWVKNFYFSPINSLNLKRLIIEAH